MNISLSKGVLYIKTLNIETYFKPKDGLPGVSHPARILASDGKQYFLKGNYGYFGDKWIKLDAALAQELFAYQLAEYLSLPVTNVALIEIEESDLDIYSDLRFRHHIMTAGIYLATEAVETANQTLGLLLEESKWDIPQTKKKINNFFKKLQNKDDISKIIYFDLLTANVDRYSNAGNLIFKKANDGTYILAIDFGYCFFGPYWTSNEYILNLSKIKLLTAEYPQITNWGKFMTECCFTKNGRIGAVFSLLEKYIKFEDNPFASSHYLAVNLESNKLTDMLMKIPDDWLIQGNHQRTIYLNFILNQVKQMPGILDFAVRSKFFTNNHTGGSLQWHKEQNTLVQ